MTLQIPLNGKSYKSVVLTKEEHLALKKLRKKYNTESLCAEEIGISRQVLNRALLRGSASPETINMIRKSILSKCV